MRVAILSCSRSGSTYASVFFMKMGLKIRHEKLGRDGGVGWPLVRMVEREDFDVILHQVRSPWDAIASMPTHDNSLWKRVYRIMGIQKPRRKPPRCLKYWIEWNKRCEEKASFTYRVEDLRKGTETIMRLSSILGFDPAGVPEVSVRTNTRRRKSFKKYFKGDVAGYFRKNYFELYSETRELAERYGYDVSWFEDLEEKVEVSPEAENPKDSVKVALKTVKPRVSEVVPEMVPGPRIWVPSKVEKVNKRRRR